MSHNYDALALLLLHRHLLPDNGAWRIGLKVYLGVHAKSIIIGRNLLSMYHKLYSAEVVKLIPVFIDAMRTNPNQTRRFTHPVTRSGLPSAPVFLRSHLRFGRFTNSAGWSRARSPFLLHGFAANSPSHKANDRWHVGVICTHASSSLCRRQSPVIILRLSAEEESGIVCICGHRAVANNSDVCNCVDLLNIRVLNSAKWVSSSQCQNLLLRHMSRI